MVADNTSNRGFASMDADKQKEIASKGGKASGGNFKNDPQRASEAGKKGGSKQQLTYLCDPTSKREPRMRLFLMTRKGWKISLIYGRIDA